jgi:hypothetical protein
MVELYLHSPICLHGVVLNSLSTGTTLPVTDLVAGDSHPADQQILLYMVLDGPSSLKKNAIFSLY